MAQRTGRRGVRGIARDIAVGAIAAGAMTTAAAGGEPVRITAATGALATPLDGQDVIVDGVTVIIDGPRRFKSLWVTNGGIVTHRVGAGEALELTVDENVRVDAGCAISAMGRGGGSSIERSADGGAVRLVVGGVLSVDGWVSANGRDGKRDGESGGNGGSVQIVAAALVGEGRIVARGGVVGPIARAGAAHDKLIGGSGGEVRVRVGTARGIGTISAAPGEARSWGAGRDPVLEVDLALYPEGGGVTSEWAMWRVEGTPGAGWALVE